MRKFVLLTLAAAGLCGCAADQSQREAAIARCEQVGITQKDPQFETCAYAYGLQARQDALENAFDKQANPFPDPRERRIPSWFQHE